MFINAYFRNKRIIFYRGIYHSDRWSYSFFDTSIRFPLVATVEKLLPDIRYPIATDIYHFLPVVLCKVLMNIKKKGYLPSFTI